MGGLSLDKLVSILYVFLGLYVIIAALSQVFARFRRSERMTFRRHAILIFPVGLAPVFCVAAMILANVHWYYIVLAPHIPEGEYSIKVEVDPREGQNYLADATIQISREADDVEGRDPDFSSGYTMYRKKVALTEITWASGRSRYVNDVTVQPGRSVEIMEPIYTEVSSQDPDSYAEKADEPRDRIKAHGSNKAYEVTEYQDQTVTVPYITPELLGVTYDDKIQSIGWLSIAEHILVFVCALFVSLPFTFLLPEWAGEAEQEERYKEHQEQDMPEKKKD